MARTALLAGAPFSQEPAFPRELASCPAHDMRPGLPAVATLFLPFSMPLSALHTTVSRRAVARSFAFAVADVAPLDVVRPSSLKVCGRVESLHFIQETAFILWNLILH